MRSLTTDAQTALAQPVVGLAQLVFMDFGGGSTIALNSTNMNLTWGGVTYIGAAGLGSIEPIDDSPGEIKGVQFTMAGVSAEQIGLALDDSGDWQGAVITIRTAILDANWQIVDAPVEWSGYGDTMSLSEDGETASVTATAESTAVDLLRGSPLTYSDADQQSLYPGDRAFEYVDDQADQTVVWPSKAWFYK